MNRKKIALTVLGIIVLLTSCEKKNEILITESTKSTKSIERLDLFDSIGALHNEMLDYFGSAMRDTLDMYAEIGVMSECEINHLTNRFLEKGVEFSTSYGITERTPQMVETYYRSLGSDTNIVDSLLGNSLHRFEQLLSTLDYTNINNAISELTQAKQSVCLNLQTIDDTSLAIMISVYKYSLEYWYNVSIDNTNPWYNFYRTDITVNENDGYCSDYYTANYIKKVLKKIGGFFSDIFNAVVNSKPFEVAVTDVVSAAVNFAFLSTVPTVDPISIGAKILCSAVDGAVMSYLSSK